MPPDLHTTRQRLLDGSLDAGAVAQAAIDRVLSDACRHVFMQTNLDEVRTAAARSLGHCAAALDRAPQG